jgi:tetratricopeptide (TPR) repeat protein
MSNAATVELSPGIPIETAIAGGEVHVYQFSLLTGQYLRITAEQQTADVQLTVWDPRGSQIIESDTLSDMAGPEFVSLVADLQGEYRLEVRAADQQASAGRYRVRIDELRPARDDRTRVAAQKLFAEGRAFENKGSIEAYARAMANFEQALSIWRTLHDTWHEALALNAIGDLDLATGKVQAALASLNEALPLWQTSGDASGEAGTLDLLGIVYTRSGDIPRALELGSKAVSLCHAVGDRLQEPRLAGNLGATYTYLGQHEKALSYYIEMREAEHAAGNHRAETIALVNLSSAYYMLGEHRKALDQLTQARSIVRSDDQQGLAWILENFGVLYSNLGDIGRGATYYAQALSRFHDMGDAFKEMEVLQHMGDASRRQHDYEKALAYLQQALSISQTSKAQLLEPYVLARIGSVYADLGDKPKALSYYTKAIQSNWSSEDGKAGAMVEASLLYPDPKTARQSINAALSISQSLHVKRLEARALAARARLEHDQGKLNEARGDLQSTLQIIETARAELSPGGLRTAYFATNRRVYELYIDVLMELHQASSVRGCVRN